MVAILGRTHCSATSHSTLLAASAAVPTKDLVMTNSRRAAVGAAFHAILALPATAFAQDFATLPQNLTAWGMFASADWVVKAVIIGLTIASVVTWTVLVAKSLELRKAASEQRKAFAAIEGARSLVEASKLPDSAGSPLIIAAVTELRLSSDALEDGEGLKERVASRFERIEAAISRKMTMGTTPLGTIGATAPFVGLFGTVWGIMNSFIGISQKQTTDLAVVAPGIAEALLATAIGLIAAIPAVVIYNHFARQIAAHRAMVADSSAAVLRLVSRDLSRGIAGRADLRAAE